MKRLVLIGPPASGKGTLARRLSQALDIPVVSTGKLLRDEEKARSEIGLLSLELSKTGTLVPDSAVLSLMQAWIELNGCRFLSDGFPRTVPQAEAFTGVLARCGGRSLDVVLALDAPEDVRRERAGARLTCQVCDWAGAGKSIVNCPACGAPLVRRRDDASHVFDLRMEQYRAKTEPVVDFYREEGILLEIDASGVPEEVFRSAESALAGWNKMARGRG